MIFYADMRDKTVVKSFKWIFPGDFKENIQEKTNLILSANLCVFFSLFLFSSQHKLNDAKFDLTGLEEHIYDQLKASNFNDLSVKINSEIKFGKSCILKFLTAIKNGINYGVETKKRRENDKQYFVYTSFSKQNLVNECFPYRFQCKNLSEIHCYENKNQYYFCKIK